MAKQHIKLTVNGKADRGAGRAAHAADPFPARGAGADRRAHRLRDQPLRRLHRRSRRPLGEVLHGVRGAGRTAPRSSPSRAWPAADGSCIRSQEAFLEHHGLQCGFCTPGMIMRAYRLLQENPDPTEDEIRCGLSGNLCRCTGYQNIVKAVRAGRGPDAIAHEGGRGMSADTELTHEQREATLRRHRLRQQAQGGRPLHPGQGQLCRRCQAARHAVRRLRPQPLRPRPDQERSTPSKRQGAAGRASRCSPPTT